MQSPQTSAALKSAIEELFREAPPQRSEYAHALLREFRQALNKGEIRVAEPAPDHVWGANQWVKKGILLHTRLGLLTECSENRGRSFEYDTMPLRRFSKADGVRIPPGGTTIRDGVYLAPGVTCMPPSFVNIGAYLGANTVVDSHTTVGAGTQIGARVRITSGTQIGGLIEPLQHLPTIIGDDVVIGGQCGIYDGVAVGSGAVLSAGTILTRQSRIYDPKTKEVYCASAGRSLVVPPRAVIAPGARLLNKGAGAKSGLMLQVLVILGWRDDGEGKDFIWEDLME